MRLRSNCVLFIVLVVLQPRTYSENKTEPKNLDYLPTRFETESYKFRGNWTVVKWDGKALQIEIAVAAKAKNSTLTPSPAAWKAFWKDVDAINVWKWNKQYIDKSVADGHSWRLGFERGDKKVNCEGSNLFPPQFERYERALERLLASKAGD